MAETFLTDNAVRWQLRRQLRVSPGERQTEVRMVETRDWKGMKEMSARLLEERTGANLAAWNRRVKARNPRDEKELRGWLSEQGVAGYAQTLLVMERFGYPDWYLASANDLIEAQYADRPELRPILDAILKAASGLGEVVVQARKTYVSLVGRKRTFARVQPTTKSRVDLGLRLAKQKPGGRLKPSRIQETMRLQIELHSHKEVDAEVLGWLKKAYEESSQAERSGQARGEGNGDEGTLHETHIP